MASRGSWKMSRVPLESSPRAVSKSQGPVRSLRGSRKAMFRKAVKTSPRVCCDSLRGSPCKHLCASSSRACLEPSGDRHLRGCRAPACCNAFSHPSLPTADPQYACSDRWDCVAGMSLQDIQRDRPHRASSTHFHLHVMEPGAYFHTFSSSPP